MVQPESSVVYSLEVPLCPHWHGAEENCFLLKFLISVYSRIRQRLVNAWPSLAIWSSVSSLSVLGSDVQVQGKIWPAFFFPQQKLYFFRCAYIKWSNYLLKPNNKLSNLNGLVWLEPFILWGSVAFISKLVKRFVLISRVIWSNNGPHPSPTEHKTFFADCK